MYSKYRWFTGGNLFHSRYIKDIFSLGAGILLSQFIALLASPILTRLFTPADFGKLAILMAVVSSLSMAACGRYDMAMLLPKKNNDAQHLFGIAFYSAVISSSFLFGVLFFAQNQLSLISSLESLSTWIFLAPILLFVIGMSRTAGYFANRQKDFHLIARSKIAQSAVTVGASIGLGLIGVGFAGLAFGILLGFAVATTYFVYKYRHKLEWKIILSWNRKKGKLISRFKDYPVFSASSSIVDGVTQNIPVFFIAYYFPEPVVGYYALVLRIANAPLSFLWHAISQVNLKKVVELGHAAQPITPYIYKVTAGLVAIIFLPSLIFIIWSPQLFSWVFGMQWYEAGVYAQLLMLSLAVRFVASTLSGTLEATNNTRYGAAWKVTSFVVTIMVFAVYAPQRDIIQLLQAYVISDIILYLFFYYLIVRAAKYPKISES